MEKEVLNPLVEVTPLYLLLAFEFLEEDQLWVDRHVVVQSRSKDMSTHPVDAYPSMTIDLAPILVNNSGLLDTWASQ